MHVARKYFVCFRIIFCLGSQPFNTVFFYFFLFTFPPPPSIAIHPSPFFWAFKHLSQYSVLNFQIIDVIILVSNARHGSGLSWPINNMKIRNVIIFFFPVVPPSLSAILVRFSHSSGENHSIIYLFMYC